MSVDAGAGLTMEELGIEPKPAVADFVADPRTTWPENLATSPPLTPLDEVLNLKALVCLVRGHSFRPVATDHLIWRCARCGRIERRP